MAECVLMKTGGGTGSDECTATKGDVLAGKTAVTSDSDDEAVGGTMPNKGAWTARISVNGKAVIPAGYHNGTGYVDQAITNRGAWTGRIGVNGKLTIPEGYHNGSGYIDQAIAKYTGTPKAINNVRIANNRFEVAVDAGYYDCYWNGNSYEYMTFAQVASALGLTAAKIKKGETVCGVTGTWEGYVANPTDLYYNGTNSAGLKKYGSDIFESNQISYNNSSSMCDLRTAVLYNLTGYSGLTVEGNLHFYGYGAKLYASGVQYESGDEISSTKISSDGPFGSVSFYFNTQITKYLRITLGNLRKGSYIRRIRLF